jgi:RHS repeat-associated protein
LKKAFVPLPGGGTAIYNSSGLSYYRHSDWLGRSRLTSTQGRGLYSSQAYAPFGEQYATFPTAGSLDPSYTGQNSDTEPNLYDFTFREHSMSQGRWISPDPLGVGAVNPASPQTWNRYSYVANNPLSGIDPLGLYQPAGPTCGPDPCGGGGGGVDGTTYTLDGLDTPTGIVQWLLSIGAAGQCPGNDCGPYVGTNGLLTSFYSVTLDSDGWGYVGPWGNVFADGSEFGLPELPDETPDYSLGNAANNGPTNPATPPPCQAKILNATNNHFGTNYTDANVSSTFNYSTGAAPGQGTLNLNISGSTAGVTTGYAPVNWCTYVIGYGPTLHVVSGPGGNGGLDSQDTLQFLPNQATLHIDSGFPYNPIGLFFHWLLNMTKAGGYPQC